MLDSTLINIIPPIVATILTYVISSKKARIEQAKIVATIQTNAIEQVRLAEEKMRLEIWAELQKVRDENASLREEINQQRNEIDTLKHELEISSNLKTTLIEQIDTLKNLVDTYKHRIIELENKNK